jgi:hypothetical protein
MINKIFGLALSALLLALGVSAEAQQPAKMPRLVIYQAPISKGPGLSSRDSDRV